MHLSAAARVGLATIAGFLVLIGMVTYFNNEGPSQGQQYVVIFQNVGGLQVKAPVLLAGVRVGSVKKIELVTDSSKVRVTMLIDRPQVRLYRNRQKDSPPDSFYVYTVAGNLLGDKWLDIRTGKIPLDTPVVKPTDPPLIGEAPVSLDDLAREGYDVMGEFRQSVVALNNLVADDKFQRDIKQSVGNFAEISDNLKGASQDARGLLNGLKGRVERLSNSVELVVSHVDDTVRGLQADAQGVSSDLRGVSSGARDLFNRNSGRINDIVVTLHQTAVGLNSTIAQLQSVAGNKEMKSDLTAAVQNLRKTSQEVQGIATDVRSITADPEVQSDLRDTIHNAHEASEGAKRAVKNVNGIMSGAGKGKLVEADLENEWDVKSGHPATNANIFLLPNASYGLKLGVDSLGQQNLYNIQVMKNMGNFRLRGGLVRSQFGVGADYKLLKKVELSADVYNTRRVKVDLTGRVLFPGDFYLLGGYRDVTQSEHGYPILGAGKRF
jgi:ABC-type transporter Mla subunit MlaD